MILYYKVLQISHLVKMRFDQTEKRLSALVFAEKVGYYVGGVLQGRPSIGGEGLLLFLPDVGGTPALGGYSGHFYLVSSLAASSWRCVSVSLFQSSM